MSKRRVHFANIRLRVNAGITLPECKADAPLLDMDASRLLAMSGTIKEVTCISCLCKLIKSERAKRARAQS
jgi:hypothetical protein